ncbi:MAG: ABC transporter ATP-binding protein [Microvirga sp.]|nr:ABC transporter ATP-binding protein [Microvirga sp.]
MSPLAALAPTLRHEAPVAEPKIAIRNLSVDFPSPDGKTVRVLDDVSLDVAAGEFVAVVGPSGCGKSTLLRVLSGLAPPAEGTASIDGRSLADATDRIGFMFQRDTLLPWATVEENVLIGSELGPRRIDRARLAELIAFLKLRGFEKHRPHELSGGMRQRVSLGRLLAYEPEIFLMDEPFGALDSQTKAAMGHELLRIWSAHQRAVLFVTHDIEEAVTLADRVVVLSARPGRIRLDLRIDLERPRDPRTLRRDPSFRYLVERVWGALDRQTDE